MDNVDCILYHITEEDVTGWERWKLLLPPMAKATSEKVTPWTCYILKTTGQRCEVTSIFDDGSLLICVPKIINQDNLDKPYDVEVFGINPNDLEPCRVPATLPYKPRLDPIWASTQKT